MINCKWLNLRLVPWVIPRESLMWRHTQKSMQDGATMCSQWMHKSTKKNASLRECPSEISLRNRWGKFVSPFEDWKHGNGCTWTYVVYGSHFINMTTKLTLNLEDGRPPTRRPLSTTPEQCIQTVQELNILGVSCILSYCIPVMCTYHTSRSLILITLLLHVFHRWCQW